MWSRAASMIRRSNASPAHFKPRHKLWSLRTRSSAAAQHPPPPRCLDQCEAPVPAFHCGQSLKSMIPIMIIEPAAIVSEQITGNSSRTAITVARPLILFICAKRHPATPIRNPRLAPSSSAV
jgi:hypothetical protein